VTAHTTSYPAMKRAESLDGARYLHFRQLTLKFEIYLYVLCLNVPPILDVSLLCSGAVGLKAPLLLPHSEAA
jgi:hypothetical protein